MPNPTLQDSIHEWEAEQGVTDATMLAGQLEVIAEELRTANLIALLEHIPAPHGREKLHDMIIDRLGLS